MPYPPNTPEKFWTQCRMIDHNSFCWFWKGHRDQDGYGTLRFQGRRWKAHRLAYFLTNGPIPSGAFVCHRCDNPHCVNPSHLFLGSPADNMADKVAKQRQTFGTRISTAKLIPSQVVEIRALLQMKQSQRSIARLFGVSPTLISAINTGKVWKSVGKQCTDGVR